LAARDEQSAMTAPFDTTTGEKQICRERFIAAVADYISNPSDIFVLPSENARDATMLWERWPEVRIDGVERDEAVFKHINRTHRLRVYHGTVGGYIRTMIDCDRELKAPTFDAAFLDYMGAAKPGDVADICGFVDILSKPRFVLGLTFMKAARGASDKVEDFVRSKAWLEEDEGFDDGNAWNTAQNLANAICQAIERGYQAKDRPRTRAMAADIRRLDLLVAHTYRANLKSAEMHFIIIYIERFK
jgi:hypothetical protein